METCTGVKGTEAVCFQKVEDFILSLPHIFSGFSLLSVDILVLSLLLLPMLFTLLLLLFLCFFCACGVCAEMCYRTLFVSIMFWYIYDILYNVFDLRINL